MTIESRSGITQQAAARPVSELLDCPPPVRGLLSDSARTIPFEAGQLIFRQGSPCAGLYLVVLGSLQRRTDRETRVMLGISRPGDLIELSAALGNGLHTCSLIAQSDGSLLLLPMETLRQAFESHPPLRMNLLRELAREVSRAYRATCLASRGRTRRSSLDFPQA